MGSSPSAMRPGKAKSQRKSYKIVLVGDPESGKTNVYLRYCKNQFDFQYKPTTSINIGTAVRFLPCAGEGEGEHVSVQLWDLPGEDAPELRQRYYKDADGAIVVVDSVNAESIDSAGVWYSDVTSRHESQGETASGPSPSEGQARASPFPVLLMGAKHDLLDSEEFLLDEDRKRDLLSQFEIVAEQTGFVGRVYVSAKSGDNSVYSAVNFLLQYLSSPITLNAEEEEQPDASFTDSGGAASIIKSLPSKKKERLEAARLQRMGIPEVDDLLDGWAESILIVKRISSQWQRNRKEFTRVCRMLPGTSSAPLAAVEQCCLVIRKVLQRKDMKLQVIDNEFGLVTLAVDGERSAVTASARNAIDAYHTQVLTAMEQILTLCPECCEKLGRGKEELERVHGLPQNDRHKRKLLIKHCHGALADGMTLADMLVKDVEATLSKVRACLSW